MTYATGRVIHHRHVEQLTAAAERVKADMRSLTLRDLDEAARAVQQLEVALLLRAAELIANRGVEAA